MMKDQRAIIRRESDGIALYFREEDFNEFISSLLESPRVHRKVFEAGFKISKSEVVSLVHKLDQRASQNDLFHRSGSIYLEYQDGLKIEKTFDQFQGEELSYGSRIKICRLSLAYVIGFSRSEDTKAPEKQSVIIEFKSGIPGQIEIIIESTDLFWPNEVIRLIEDEIKNMPKVHPGVRQWQKSIFPFFRGMNIKGIRVTPYFMLCFFPIFMAFAWMHEAYYPEPKYIFTNNPQQIEKLREDHISTLGIREIGWRLNITQSLLEARLAAYPDGKGPASLLWHNYKKHFYIGLGFFFVGLFYFLLLFVLYHVHRASLAGVLSDLERFPQETETIQLEQVLISILGGIISGAIIFVISLVLAQVW